jgi:ribosomal protein S18 acetylase RimI-like enzyme
MMDLTPSHPSFDRVAQLFDEYRTHYGFASAPAATRAWLTEQLDTSRLSLYADDETTGLITTTVLPASLTLRTFWQIRDLYVAPSVRRAGTARRLLRHVVDKARAAGAIRISLQTEIDNTAALALYTSLGFTPVTGLMALSLVAA